MFLTDIDNTQKDFIICSLVIYFFRPLQIQDTKLKIMLVRLSVLMIFIVILAVLSLVSRGFCDMFIKC